MTNIEQVVINLVLCVFRFLIYKMMKKLLLVHRGTLDIIEVLVHAKSIFIYADFNVVYAPYKIGRRTCSFLILIVVKNCIITQVLILSMTKKPLINAGLMTKHDEVALIVLAVSYI